MSDTPTSTALAEPLDRRSVLRNAIVSTGIIGLAGTGSVAADEGNGKIVPGNYPPNPNVEFTRVFPFPFEQTVPAGDWIQHVFGFNPPGNSKSGVERFIANHQLTVTIDDEEVPDPKQYYLDPIKRPSDGEWIAVWAYTIPPQPPDTYEFSIATEYNDFTGGTSGEYTVQAN